MSISERACLEWWPLLISLTMMASNFIIFDCQQWERERQKTERQRPNCSVMCIPEESSLTGEKGVGSLCTHPVSRLSPCDLWASGESLDYLWFSSLFPVGWCNHPWRCRRWKYTENQRLFEEAAGELNESSCARKRLRWDAGQRGCFCFLALPRWWNWRCIHCITLHVGEDGQQ